MLKEMCMTRCRVEHVAGGGHAQSCMLDLLLGRSNHQCHLVANMYNDLWPPQQLEPRRTGRQSVLIIVLIDGTHANVSKIFVYMDL